MVTKAIAQDYIIYYSDQERLKMSYVDSHGNRHSAVSRGSETGRFKAPENK